MDDNEFDDIIKEKIGDYKHPDFDPDALHAFQSRMAAAMPRPWYVRYRNELLTAAASLFLGAVILWSQDRLHRNSMDDLFNEIGQLQIENENLKSGIIQEQGKDTVRIVEYRESTLAVDALRDQILSLQAKIDKSRKESQQLPDINPDQQLVFAGTRETLPDDVLNYFQREHQLVENGGYYFILEDKITLENELPPYLQRKNVYASHYILPEYVLMVDSINGDNELQRITSTEHVKVKIPLKQVREMEKSRYNKGIGIEVGPAGEVYQTFYSPGTDEGAFGGGVLANFITSPSLSLETGALFNTSEYLIDSDDKAGLNLPPEDTDFGEFRGIDVTSWFVEFPVNLKYRHRISARNHLVGSIGISSLLYTKQEFEYMYDYNVDGELILPVEKHFRVSESNFQFGTANLALGLSSNLKNGKRLETLIFYKQSISPVGFEEIDTQFIGVRAAYMFTVR